MLSVIIPTYNRAKYLSHALDSLTIQGIALNSFEVIVIDDGSRDSTKKICKKFESKLNLKYIYQNHKGVSSARNRGIAESFGETIIFFDDDAIADENWIGNISDIMKKEDIITGRVLPIKDNIWKYFAPHYDQGDKPIESDVLLEGNCAMKKKVFDVIGKFDDKLTYGHEGKEFINRAKKKYKIMYYPNVIIKHDYAFGIFNYLNKQFKFGHKMVYLNQRGNLPVGRQVKSLSHLILNYKDIKKEGTSKPRKIKKEKINFFRKLQIYILAKLGALFNFLGAVSGYLKYKK